MKLMNVAEFAEKLIQAGNLLNEINSVFESLEESRPAIANVEQRAKQANEPKKRKPYVRKQLHWTQKPQNRAKLNKVVRKMLKAKKNKG